MGVVYGLPSYTVSANKPMVVKHSSSTFPRAKWIARDTLENPKECSFVFMVFNGGWPPWNMSSTAETRLRVSWNQLERNLRGHEMTHFTPGSWNYVTVVKVDLFRSEGNAHLLRLSSQNCVEFPKLSPCTDWKPQSLLTCKLTALQPFSQWAKPHLATSWIPIWKTPSLFWKLITILDKLRVSSSVL